MVKVDPQDVLMYQDQVMNDFDSNNEYVDNHAQFNDLTNHRPPPDGYQCSVCLETFIIKEDLLIHRRSHRFSYSCTECTKMFDSAGELNSHVKGHAASKMKQANMENRHGKGIARNYVTICLSLTHNIYSNTLLYVAAETINYRDYSPSPPLTFAELSDAYIACDDCGETFSDNQSLKVHYLGHFGLVETAKVVQAPMQVSQPHGSGNSGMIRDRNLVPFGTNSFQYHSTPSSMQSFGQGQRELAQYSEFLMMSENMKRVAFGLNDATLMNKMLDVESHVAGKIMDLRHYLTSPPIEPSQFSPSP